MSEEPRIHGPLLDAAYVRVVDEGRYTHAVCVACFADRLSAVVDHWLGQLSEEPGQQAPMRDDQLRLEDRRSKVMSMVEFGTMLGIAAVDAEQEQIMGEATSAE